MGCARVKGIFYILGGFFPPNTPHLNRDTKGNEDPMTPLPERIQESFQEHK